MALFRYKGCGSVTKVNDRLDRHGDDLADLRKRVRILEELVRKRAIIFPGE